jgi:hypothetical protein
MKISQASAKKSIWVQIASIFALPILGLYIIAYRLLGIPYTYRFGNFDLIPRKKLTKNQHLFIRTFPMIVLLPIFVIFMLLLGQPLN